MESREWIKLNYRENRLVCLRCKVEEEMPSEPIEIGLYLKMLTAFGYAHKWCRKAVDSRTGIK